MLVVERDLDDPQAKHGVQATISTRKWPTLAKMAAEGNLFSKNTNLKNGELFFNPFKEAILDSSDHTVTLENGHILAGKKKPSPPKKSTRANHQKKTTSGNFTGGNPIPTQTTTISSTEAIVFSDSPQKLSQDSSLNGPSSFGSAIEPKVLDDSTPEEVPSVAIQSQSTIRPPAFLFWSPSDFLIPLAKTGYVQTSRKSPLGNHLS